MGQKTNRKGNSGSRLPGRAAVMRTSLIISLSFHVCVLLVIQKTFPVNWISKPLRTYHVELLREPVDLLDDEEPARTDFTRIRSEHKTSPEQTEDTISLNTKDERYSSYARIIKKKLMRHWTYPREAWENLIEGNVLVLFTLNREGHLKDIRILQPSSSDILDQEAARAIRAAVPFPPFPGSVTVVRLNIKANFAYKLTPRR